MTDEYSIQELENIFLQNHEKAIKYNSELLEKHKENYPTSEIPSHFLDDFSINKALYVICKEINRINNETQSPRNS